MPGKTTERDKAWKEHLEGMLKRERKAGYEPPIIADYIVKEYARENKRAFYTGFNHGWNARKKNEGMKEKGLI